MLEILNEQEAADRLRVSIDTLRRMRQRGEGPSWHRVGHGIRYQLADLIAFMDEVRRESGPGRVGRVIHGARHG